MFSDHIPRWSPWKQRHFLQKEKSRVSATWTSGDSVGLRRRSACTSRGPAAGSPWICPDKRGSTLLRNAHQESNTLFSGEERVCLPVVCHVTLHQVAGGQRRHERQLSRQHRGTHHPGQLPGVVPRALTARPLYAQHLEPGHTRYFRGMDG